MITLYSGTPGSGKSLSVAEKIVVAIESGKTVISNMIVDLSSVHEKNNRRRKPRAYGEYIKFENATLTPEFLVNFALENHAVGFEGQTLLIFDEVQMKFSPSVVKLMCQEDKNFRVKWLDFFTQHRHLGYDVIFVTQFDKLLDAQIRCLIEYNYIHRKVNNYGNAFCLFLDIVGVKLFSQVQYWYGSNMRIGGRMFLFSKRYSKIYDSYARFSELQRMRQQQLEKQTDSTDQQKDFCEA